MRIQCISNKYLTIIVTLLFVCSIFVSTNYFVETILSQSYCFIVCSLVGGVSVLIHFFFTKRERYKVNKVYVTILMFLLYLIFRSLPRISNINILFFISFGILLVLFNNLCKKNIEFINVFLVSVVSCQAIYGLVQFFNLLESIPPFPIVGSFDNPAGFSICLSSIFPLCFAIRRENSFLKFIFNCSIVIIPLAVLLSGSRSGIITIIVTSLFYLLYTHRNLLNRVKPRIILFSIVFMLISFLFLIKIESSFGRFYIWNISVDMMSENLIFGGGKGFFLEKYMMYQGEYLKSNLQGNFAFLADNVFHPFNEYILLTLEYGISGLLLLLLIIKHIIVFTNKTTLVYFLCVLSVLIFGMFSYPLKYPFTLILIAYCIARIVPNNGIVFHLNSLSRGIVIAVGIMSCVIFSRLLIKDMLFEFRWKKNLVIANSREEGVIEEYRTLFKNWNMNYQFLYNYSAILNHFQKYQESLTIAYECHAYLNNYDVQILIANNYFNLNQLDYSEKYYTTALNMCPNRFVPLIQLMHIYDLTDQSEMAVFIANQIISQKIKVPSPSIANIKLEAWQRINSSP